MNLPDQTVNGFSAGCGDGSQHLNAGPSCYCEIRDKTPTSPCLSFLTYELGIMTLLPIS